MEPTLLQSGEVADVGVLVDALNYTWVLVVCFLIFFMHAGFAMLEAGQVRSKNVANQLTKNLLTWSVGVVAFFLVGAGVSSLVGGGGFTWIAGEDPGSWANGWFYGAVFAMTAATIVSGAVAGRAKLRAYVAYTVLLRGGHLPGRHRDHVVRWVHSRVRRNRLPGLRRRDDRPRHGRHRRAHRGVGTSVRAWTGTTVTGASMSFPVTR